MVISVSFNKRLPPGAAKVGRGTLAELMAKQKRAVEGTTAAQEMQTPTIMQGFGKLAQVAANAWGERRAEDELSAGRDELARLQSGISDQGATPAQIAEITRHDPELGEQYRREAIQARADAAARQAEIDSREDQQQHAVTMQGGQQTFTAGQNDLTRTHDTTERVGGETFTAGQNDANRQLDIDLQGEKIRAEQDAAVLQEKRLQARPGTEGAKVLDAYDRGQYGRVGSEEAIQRRDQEFTNVTTKGPGTVINTGESTTLRNEFNKAVGSKLIPSYMKEAGNAGTLTRAMEVIEQINPADQGPLVGRLAQMFPGVSSQAALFESVVKKAAPSQREEGSGSTSDIEYDGMLKALPQLINDPVANRAISAAVKAQASISVARGNLITQWQSGKIDDAQMFQKMNELNSQSILSEELRNRIEAINANRPVDVTGGGGSWTVDEVQ